MRCRKNVLKYVCLFSILFWGCLLLSSFSITELVKSCHKQEEDGVLRQRSGQSILLTDLGKALSELSGDPNLMKLVQDRASNYTTLLHVLTNNTKLLKALAPPQQQGEGAGRGVHEPTDGLTLEELKVLWPPQAVQGDPGYEGHGVKVDPAELTPVEKEKYDNGYRHNKINRIAADRIPLRRNIPFPLRECKGRVYSSNLPTAGVVLIFHNEMWSVILRTVYSILDAGPEELITEIVLVDDASDRDDLGQPLEAYVRSMFGSKVKLVRLPERSGLIKARLAGFDHVTGEVAVFLDAHCEVHKGWLEPLVQRIQEDDTVVAVPSSDGLDRNTFQFSITGNNWIHTGGLDWDLNFDWYKPGVVDGIERKTLADPLKTPTHMGCCLAVSKHNFERLGRYDPELEIWGCENLELSLKTWMCGGRLEIIPCSHIGHLYRPGLPYTWGGHDNFQLIKNCLRVAEVWMDEYKHFYYERIDNVQTKLDIGDLTERKALRERLQCKSFDWYAKEIFPDLYFPFNTTASGHVSSVADSHLCFQADIRQRNPTPPTNCDPHNRFQFFVLSKEKQLRRDNGCVDLGGENRIEMKSCETVNGEWIYTEANTIMHVQSGLCLTLTEDKSDILMLPCTSQDDRQQWAWPRRSVQFPSQS